MPRMGGGETRQVLVLTVLITALVTAGFAIFGDVVTALVAMPLVASAAFWSLRISTRLGRRMRGEPPAEQERPPVSTPPSTERPEHARRRRQRRTPRGRQR